MVDFAGMPPIGSGGINIRHTADPATQPLPAVESGSAGQGLSGRMTSGQSHTNTGSGDQGAAQTASAEPLAKPDPDAPTGPPPSFQITVLEADRDLDRVLARLNTEHALQEDASLIAVEGTEHVPSAPAADSMETDGTDTPEPSAKT